MGDRRVERLTYEVKWQGPHRVSSDDRLRAELPGFACSLEKGTLVAEPIASFASPESARAELEPHLRDWEVEWELLESLPIRFDYQGAQLVDAEDATAHMISLDGGIGVDAVVSIEGDRWPVAPALRAKSSALVQSLLARWHDVLQGRERLLVGANWILTTLERELGGRQGVADRLNISMAAVRKLGELAARNDPVHGRKGRGDPAPLTGEEIGWVNELLRHLVTLAAQNEAGQVPPRQLTMDDLPGI